jgi:hypothetical protein
MSWTDARERGRSSPLRTLGLTASVESPESLAASAYPGIHEAHAHTLNPTSVTSPILAPRAACFSDPEVTRLHCLARTAFHSARRENLFAFPIGVSAVLGDPGLHVSDGAACSVVDGPAT